jgi:hypothetical protein
MTRETLVATDAHGRSVRFQLDVFADGDHWTSTLARLNEHDTPDESRVAPRFYGVSADQARRRMISVLENQYEDLQIERRVDLAPN